MLDPNSANDLILFLIWYIKEEDLSPDGNDLKVVKTDFESEKMVTSP